MFKLAPTSYYRNCLPLLTRNSATRFLQSVIVAAFVLIISGCGGSSSSGGGGNNPPPPPPPPDFVISVLPIAATVPPGGVLLSQITINAENGFNGSVSVSITGLPTGVTISPAASFTMSAGSQNVTLSVANNANLGSFTLTVQGTSGSLQHSASVALQVQQQPFSAFLVTLNNRELSFSQGGSASTIVGLSVNQNSGNPNYEVQFSVTGLPAGVQATFGANPFLASQPATELTFAASQNSGLASYSIITVVATRTADGVQESAQFTLNVTPPVGTLPPIRSDFVRMDGTPVAAVYDPSHNVVYASNPQWNRVDVISATTHQILQSIPAPSPTGMDLGLDGKHLTVTSNVQQIVSIDTESLQVVNRTNVTPIVQGGASYAIPDLVANAANGKVLLGMTNFSAPPSYYLEEWNPATNNFKALNAPGIGAFINQLVRTGDGTKALVVDYGTDLNIAVYNSASDSFTVSGQSPVGTVLGVAGSPTTDQFAILGTNGFAIVDSNLNVLGTPPSGGVFWGMSYSPDGTKVYVAMTLLPSCGFAYPVILTYDTSSFALIGIAPGFETGSGDPCEPYSQATPLTVDSTGLVYSSYSHGMILDDATNLQNLLNLPVGPPFPGFGFTDEALLWQPASVIFPSMSCLTSGSGIRGARTSSTTRLS